MFLATESLGPVMEAGEDLPKSRPTDEMAPPPPDGTETSDDKLANSDWTEMNDNDPDPVPTSCTGEVHEPAIVSPQTAGALLQLPTASSSIPYSR